MKRIALCATVALVLAGCASVPHNDTPSGKPEVTIPKASASAARAYITNRMVDAGFTLRTDSPSQLVFGRLGRQKLVQASWGYTVAYLIVDQQPGVRVVADVHMVMYEGTPLERSYDSSFNQPSDPQGDVYKQVNDVLAGLKSKFSGTRS